MPKEQKLVNVDPQEEEEEHQEEEEREEDDDELELDPEQEEEIRRLTVEITKMEKAGNKEALADLLRQLSAVQSDSEQTLPSAIENLEKEIKLRQELKQKEELSKVRKNLFVLRQAILDWEGAVAVMEEAAQEATKNKDFAEEADAYSELATAFLAKFEMDKEMQDEDEDEEDEEVSEDVAKAMSYAEKALKICYDKNTDDKLMESVVALRANHAIAEAYMHLGQFDKAIPHWDQVLELTRGIDEEVSVKFDSFTSASKAFYAYAEALIASEEPDEAKSKEFAEKALGLFKESRGLLEAEDYENHIVAVSGLVSCYDLLKQKKECIEAQREIYDMEVKLDNEEQQIEALMTLVDMYNENDQKEEALQEIEKAKKLAESLELSDVVDQLNEMKEEIQPKKRKGGEEKRNPKKQKK
ncbi:hypothetical protein PROFUN_01057 [Planoprotostelium fungivorum]|uniref:Tetratricopeptide repeat protein 29 n=1 Tax=Planoprotostelium fungivorum TaxID=1890364 RepID=A0A2P6N4L4_9EUKA|nr:hypothetical protein PROFUN_01057 [Planoprotostelium fungivorum]